MEIKTFIITILLRDAVYAKNLSLTTRLQFWGKII